MHFIFRSYLLLFRICKVCLFNIEWSSMWILNSCMQTTLTEQANIYVSTEVSINHMCDSKTWINSRDIRCQGAAAARQLTSFSPTPKKVWKCERQWVGVASKWVRSRKCCLWHGGKFIAKHICKYQMPHNQKQQQLQQENNNNINTPPWAYATTKGSSTSENNGSRSYSSSSRPQNVLHAPWRCCRDDAVAGWRLSWSLGVGVAVGAGVGVRVRASASASARQSSQTKLASAFIHWQ